MRILAVDFGLRRVGLAAGDEPGFSATGLPTIQVTGPRRAVAAVAESAIQHQAGKIVVGMPLNMDGTRGEMALNVERFLEGLREVVDLEVVTWDERWTSLSAKRVLRAAGRKSRGDKGQVDMVAAVLILESYLQAQSFKD